MMVLARVDLPEPFGPISAWISPLPTSRSRPRRISLSSVRTCRFLISSSDISLRFRSPRRPLDGAADGLARLFFSGAGELDQLGQRGAGEGAADAALHPGPKQLRRTCLVAVVLVRAEHLALG